TRLRERPCPAIVVCGLKFCLSNRPGPVARCYADDVRVLPEAAWHPRVRQSVERLAYPSSAAEAPQVVVHQELRPGIHVGSRGWCFPNRGLCPNRGLLSPARTHRQKGADRGYLLLFLSLCVIAAFACVHVFDLIPVAIVGPGFEPILLYHRADERRVKEEPQGLCDARFCAPWLSSHLGKPIRSELNCNSISLCLVELIDGYLAALPIRHHEVSSGGVEPDSIYSRAPPAPRELPPDHSHNVPRLDVVTH